MVTTDIRESSMFISDILTYLTFILPIDEYMDSCTKVLLTPSGEWDPSDLDDV